MDISQTPIWTYIVKTPTIRVIGDFSFKIRVRYAINSLCKQHQNFKTSFLARFIVSSQRVHFDNELYILYLDNSLKKKQIEEVFLVILKTGSLEGIKTPTKKTTGAFSKFHRNIFRVSIEKQIETAAVKIAKSPPRGKVATEDQHFLMMIMRLKMYIKRISQKIENQSIISLLSANRIMHQKDLRNKHRKNIKSFQQINLLHQQEIISEIDMLIHEKRLLMQRRLISRALLGIEKWQSNNQTSDNHEKYIEKLHTINNEIMHSTKVITQRKHYHIPCFSRLRESVHRRELTNLKRKKLKYNYFTHIGSKQQGFMNRLRRYFEEYHFSSLIPNSFTESINLRFFNVLRFAFNFFFIGVYIYLINVPVQYLLIFLALGLFVFQPVSNKFAVLFMLPFVKTGGLKRLSYSQLHHLIEKRAGQGKYLCAIDLPLYTGKSSELETTIHYINRNLNNLHNTLSYYEKLGVIYQITSNTANPELRDQEIEIIKKAQAYADKLHGEGRVFFLYLHRNSSTAKKVGNILAAHLFKFHGITDSVIYTDAGRFFSTLNQGPSFDCAYGNFYGSLCAEDNLKPDSHLINENIISDIINGNKIPITRKVDFTFFIDNKNEIKPASLEKGLAVMLHPENSNISILQPEMSIEDPIHEGQKLTSAFLRMMRIARDTHNFRYLKTLHGIFQNMSAYYGKGMIRLSGYDYMVMNEVLNLKYVDSHDWQESVFNYAVFCAGSDKQISVKHYGKNMINMLVESESESKMYHVVFNQDDCIITDKNGHQRRIKINPGSEQKRIWQAVNYLDNNMDVGERELISTIGNYIRDIRWLKGDLQMFNTFYPYAKYMPAYHKFHLGNIFRRFTNELALLTWVAINFLIMSVLMSPVLLESQVIYILSLHLAVTAFGFAGIDLFLYPISFELKNRIYGIPRNYLKSTITSIFKVIRKIGVGLWQFPLYLLIAWPRILLGANSSVRILLAGIDQPVNWGAASNASISAEEVSETGIPFSKFMRSYFIIMGIGVSLWITLLFLIIQQYMISSILSVLNMGIIIVSLIFGPFVSYAISRKIKVE